MLRSQLQNKVFTHGTEEYKIALKHQRNYCNRLYKRERKQFYYNLRINDITDNKKFWKTIKPLFGDKGGTKDNIVLVEEDKIICDDAEVAQKFNDFFDNAVENLGISENKLLLNEIENPIEGDVLDAIKMYESHPSIIKIKEHVVVESQFSFTHISTDDILSEIKSLKAKKAIPHMNIPIKQLKEMIDVVSEPLKRIWNEEIIGGGKFPSKLKLADISSHSQKARNYQQRQLQTS